MVIAALVIDVGSTHRVRTRDPVRLAEGARWQASPNLATATRPLARDPGRAAVCRLKRLPGRQQRRHPRSPSGVQPQQWPEERPSGIDVIGSDRSSASSSRELAQYIANIIGIAAPAPSNTPVAAIIRSVRIDAIVRQHHQPARSGEPVAVRARRAYNVRGDCYPPRRLDNGAPEPRYDRRATSFDLNVPDDFAIHHPVRRLCGWRSSTPIPSTVAPTVSNSRPSWFTHSGPDEPSAAPGRDPRPARRTATSDTSRGRVPDPLHADRVPGSATRTGSRLRWQPTDRRRTRRSGAHPGAASSPLNTAKPHRPPPRRRSHDLKWITPQGFEFDTRCTPKPYSIRVRTVSGSS